MSLPGSGQSQAISGLQRPGPLSSPASWPLAPAFCDRLFFAKADCGIWTGQNNPNGRWPVAANLNPSLKRASAARIALLAAPANVHARPFFPFTCYALRRRAPRSPACTHARWCKRRRPTDERRDVRSAGVADWKTARRGNTERKPTAAVGPSPCDPYRHALQCGRPKRSDLLVS